MLNFTVGPVMASDAVCQKGAEQVPWLEAFQWHGQGAGALAQARRPGGIGLRAIRAGGAEIVQPVVVASVLPL